MKRASLVAITLALSACTSFTTPADYAAYRATRVAPTLDARLGAASRYLATHREGAFRAEVKAYFDRAEPLFFEAQHDSPSGLDDYLRALPDGPHRVDAVARLRELRSAERARAEEHAHSAADVERQFGRAAADRFRVRDEVNQWLARFLDDAVWKAPLSRANADLIVPWSLALPAPRCVTIEPAKKVEARRKPGEAAPPQPRGALRCTKLLELPYTVTVEGATSEARQATLEIVVVEDAEGKPLEVTVAGPDLFVRIEETVSVRAIKPSEADRRLAAIARVVDLVRGVFGKAVSKDAACKRPPTSPVVLEMACRGLSVRVRPAAASGEDDVVVIAPE